MRISPMKFVGHLLGALPGSRDTLAKGKLSTKSSALRAVCQFDYTVGAGAIV